MKHRAWNWWRAFWGRYFWSPCPLCGQMYGGHEEHGTLMESWGSGHCVCPDCAEKAAKISKERVKVWSEHGAIDPATGQFHYNVR